MARKRKSRRRGAVARRGATNVNVRVGNAPKKGRGRGRPGRRRYFSGKEKAYLVGGAAAYGYVKKNTTLLASMPKVDALGMDFTVGLALHFANKHMFRSKWVDAVSMGALMIGGYNLGAAKFDLSTAASMEGWGDDDEVIEGVIDVPNGEEDEELDEGA